MLAEYLFVYGTLKQAFTDGNNALLAPHTEFFAHASSHGALYLFEDASFIYPGFVHDESATDIVRGELYVITDKDALFEILDEYEGCTKNHAQPHQYKKQKVTVKANVAFEYQAWTYVYNWPVQGLTEVPNGNFI